MVFDVKLIVTLLQMLSIEMKSKLKENTSSSKRTSKMQVNPRNGKFLVQICHFVFLLACLQYTINAT